jgi:predicted transglutaminase-like protease
MNNNKEVNMKSDRLICSETSYPHDSTLTKRFVVKITVEMCDEFLVSVPQIFNRVKSVALWSAKKKREKKDHKGLRFCS